MLIIIDRTQTAAARDDDRLVELKLVVHLTRHPWMVYLSAFISGARFISEPLLAFPQ